jgi:hypothetical protein
MSKTVIDRETRKKIIQGTYHCFRVKERENKTRSATITDIVKLIKKELKENAD